MLFRSIIFVKPVLYKDEATDKERRGAMLRHFSVFNVAQCDGLPDALLSPTPRIPYTPTQFDVWVSTTGATIKIGGNRGYYSITTDAIHMPGPLNFKSPDLWAATICHELGHWTGHKTRLDRQLRNRFGDAEYAAEELIAELCAAYTTAALGIDGETAHHAAYLAHWIALMKSDKRAIFTAASAASKASAYLLQQAAGQDVEEAA